MNNNGPDYHYQGPQQPTPPSQQPYYFQQQQQQPPKKGKGGLIVGVIVGIVAALVIGVIIGASATSTPNAKPAPAKTVTAPAPPPVTKVVKKKVHPKAHSADDIAGIFQSCAPWDTSGTTQVADVWASNSCNVIIGYSGDPSYGDERVAMMQGDPQFQDWFIVNGGTWAVLTFDEDVAELVSHYYHVNYEAL